MIEATRRSFLSGAISLLAVSTFVPPATALMGNGYPRIFGDGRNYDAEGFQALFDGKDVIIPSDKIGINGTAGIIFHKGTFVIDREIYTNGKQLIIENAQFDGTLLHWWEAFFTHPKGEATVSKIIGKAKWKRSAGDMAIDIGGVQYSIQNKYMSEANRFRPAPPKEI